MTIVTFERDLWIQFIILIRSIFVRSDIIYWTFLRFIFLIYLKKEKRTNYEFSFIFSSIDYNGLYVLSSNSSPDIFTLITSYLPEETSSPTLFPRLTRFTYKLDEYLSRPIRIVFIHRAIRPIFVQNRTSLGWTHTGPPFSQNLLAISYSSGSF